MNINIELDDTDVLFIYGTFKKKLEEINKIDNASNCPFDKSTIDGQKAPYLAVIDKLSKQVPNLKQMDKYF